MYRIVGGGMDRNTKAKELERKATKSFFGGFGRLAKTNNPLCFYPFKVMVFVFLGGLLAVWPPDSLFFFVEFCFVALPRAAYFLSGKTGVKMIVRY